MGAFTYSTADELGDASLGITPHIPPTDIYAMLLTGDPTNSGSMANEVLNLYGYARLLVTGKMDAFIDGISVNNVIFDFGFASGGDWGDVSYIALVDSGTYGGGTMIYKSALFTPVPVNDGDPVVFYAGKYQIILD